jgi:hypothetical protein
MVEHVGIQSGGVEFDHHRWLAFGGMAEMEALTHLVDLG